MKANRIKQKLMAIALCAVIIASIMPLSAIAQTQDEATWSTTPDATVYSATEPADGPTEPVDGFGQNSDEFGMSEKDREIGGKIILAFDELKETVSQQLAPLGAPLSALDLPHTLCATVDGEAADVPVTWTCTPEYDGEAGEYIFTAVLETDYTLADGVNSPNITVVIKELSLPLGMQMKLAGEETVEEVIISQEQTAANIAAAIETALNNADIAAVVVTGSKTNTNSTLSIRMPEGKKVIWKAVLKGSTADYLIALSGKGSFEVAESAEISASSGGAIACISRYDYYAPSITVSGGEVKAVEGCAIYMNSSIMESVAVIVRGGIVSNVGSADNPTIHLMVTPYENSKVEVIVNNEGKVKSTGTNGIAIRNWEGDVLIQGAAEVSADGTEDIAIRSDSITVEGGTVTANDIALSAEKDVLVSGGVIRANNRAIYADGRNYTTTIRGGSVEATGTNGYAISSTGSVRVIDGTVTASGSNGTAILPGIYGPVVVEGGTVSASGIAIFANTADVRVSGGIVRGGNYAIGDGTRGSVTVEGGIIEATNKDGCAIIALQNILIKGGTVCANREGGIAIRVMDVSGSNLTIENGTVEAQKTAILLYSHNEGITHRIKGGTIRSDNTAIDFQGEGGSPTLVVDGGDISADNTAIQLGGRRNPTIAINGGTISADNTAIKLTGMYNPAVTVDGGTIIGGNVAIYANGVFEDPTVTVAGGMVLGSSSKYVTGRDHATIYMNRGALEVTSPGAVIAWNKPAGNLLYGLHTAADLASLPESTAKWSRMDDKSGISCGTDGFIEIDEISVVEIIANATGLDELKVDKVVNAVITYTLTGGSFASSLNALDFAPERLPDWLNITDTAIESNAVRIGLSGTPTGIREPLPLTLPGNISAAHLTDGNADVSIPVSGTVTIGAVAKGVGSFGFPSSINTTYTEGLTLESLNAELPVGYAWDTPTTALSAGNGQTFPANFTDISGNYEAASGNITVNVAKAAYTGTTTVTDRVRAGQTTIEKILTLPSLPDGASYGTVTVSGDLVDGAPSVSGTTLSYSTTSQTYGATATITIAVTDATNYNDYDVIVTVTARTPQTTTSSPVIVTPPAADKPNSPTQVEIKVPGTVDSKGNVTVSLTDKTMTDAFDKALADAKKNGNEQNGITVVLRVDTGRRTASRITINLLKTVQDTIISNKIVSIIVVVDNPHIRIGMDLATVQEINKQAKSDVNITATRMDSGKLTGGAKQAIGSRPVFDLKVNYGSGKQVQSFGSGSVSVTIPYNLGPNEKAGNVQAVYVDAKGKVHWLMNSVYDSVEKVLRLSTNHFSTYGIGYKQAKTAFKDIAGHWAREDIEFTVSRGLFSGISNTTFSPNTAMTRGMIVTALGRLANADVGDYAKSNFTDVKNDAYYMGYIEWASNNGIVNGVGGGKFAPDQSITREQMAVIMLNYAKAIGFTLPKVQTENTFADNAKISAYAKDAVKQMQMAGVISGKNGNLYDPQGTATRAEVSAVLRRYVELAISSDTMQGWTRNDSGQWMYYENGKPATGKQDIDGSTYTFDQYGVTADMPKNLQYATYTVQKGDSFGSISRKLNCTIAELERLNNKSRFSLIRPGDVLWVPEK